MSSYKNESEEIYKASHSEESSLLCGDRNNKQDQLLVCMKTFLKSFT